MNHQRLILEALNLVYPRLLSAAVLRSDLRVHGIELSDADLKGHLAALEAKEQIVIVTGEDAVRVKITAPGRARLAE